MTPQQITANQLIPLPEPARRGLVNAATDVAERPTRPWLQPLTSRPPNLRRARQETLLGVVAEPPRIVRFRSIIPNEEDHHDEPNHIGSQWRRNRCGTAQLGTRMPSTQAAVELLIRSRGGRFLEPGQPWLRTDDRGITWLDAHVIERYSHAVSSEERHILALVEALALGKRSKMWAVSWPAWTPTISVSFGVLRHAGCGSGRHVIPQKTPHASACDD